MANFGLRMLTELVRPGSTSASSIGIARSSEHLSNTHGFRLGYWILHQILSAALVDCGSHENLS